MSDAAPGWQGVDGRLEQLSEQLLRATEVAFERGSDSRGPSVQEEALRPIADFGSAAIAALQSSVEQVNRDVFEQLLTNLTSIVDRLISVLFSNRSAEAERERSAFLQEFRRWLTQAEENLEGSSVQLNRQWLTARIRLTGLESVDALVASNQAKRRQDEERQARTIHEAEQVAALASEAAASAASASERALTARNESVKAAGKSGATALEELYARYARRNHIASWIYLGFTIAFLIAIIILATYFVVSLESASSDALESNSVERPWRVAVYRIAILAALSALAAYLGRQSSHHRKLADWARALAVQLQGFIAFVEPIEDAATANAVRLAFATRVLGSPPESAANHTDASPLTRLLSDAATRFPR